MSGLEYTRITSFHLLFLVGVFIGGILMANIGWKFFGLVGAVLGGLLGAYLGGVLALIPERWAGKAFFKDIEESSTERLWEIVNRQEEWNFYHTMALLHLAGRGEDVQPKLPHILTMLESAEMLERVYGWDALRLVFTEEAKKLEGYAPRATAEECQEKLNHYRSLTH